MRENSVGESSIEGIRRRSTRAKMLHNSKFNLASFLLIAISLATRATAEDCCEPGDVKLDPDDCTKYFVCCTGKFKPMSCPSGEYWNAGAGQCEIDNGECNCNGQTCIEGDIITDANNCSNFKICVNGKYQSEPCPSGEYWNSAAHECQLDEGQCVGTTPPPVCLDGEVKENEANCAGYYNCTNGQWVGHLCNAGKYWNVQAKECQKDEGQCNGGSECEDGDVKENEDNCAGYYNCINGTYVPQLCGAGLYWSVEAKDCVVDNGECNGPQGPDCDDGTVVVNPSNCSGFYNCTNGKFVFQLCGSGLYWNNTIQACEKDEGQCVGTPSPVCEEGALKVDDDNCAGYLQCINNSWVNKDCAAQSYFDKDLLTCVIDSDGVCVCADGDLKVNTANCTGYYNCTNGQYVAQFCASGLYWNSEDKQCQKDEGQCNPTPSPVCVEGSLKVDDANCAGYLQCTNNSWVTKECGTGNYFDKDLLACVVDSDGVCVPKECVDGDLKANTANCTGYYNCTNGQYVAQFCGSGLYWNAADKQCQKDEGQCNPTPSPVCVEGSLKVDDANCAGYLQCTNNSWVTKECGTGNYFDKDLLGVCVVDSDGVCVPKECVDGDLKANTANCTGYYNCTNGQYVAQFCGSGLYWNAADKQCQKDEGQCNPTPSPVCVEGSLKVDDANCAGYLQCTNNLWVTKECGTGNYFDKDLLACVVDSDGVCVPKECVDGDVKENTENCAGFYNCTNGQYVAQLCGSGLYWNAADKQCQKDEGQCNATPSPVCEEGTLKVNEANCAGYLQCVNNAWVARLCASQSYFNADLLACVVDTDGVCVPKVCDPECCDQPNDWLGPVDNNCSAFVHCLYGNKFEMRCPNNLQFNNVTKECDYPENVQCEDGSEPPSGPTAGPSGTYCESKGRCVGQSDGTMLADEDACSSSYIVCQCECAINFKCNAGLVFNQKLKVCDWPTSVDC
ncbi:chitin-binding domain protein cbd-1 [Drosophila albomicans]|uniref:Chitin-binding domain protein cbd-1 n=1 Tax=Drosophila albomicans TaxID=7291 RepID=A0A9C6T3B4_DROAB|nr:chitin-binding domain protein cbd-1 [Drosophila albomicans]